jgi:hypothetical protein
MVPAMLAAPGVSTGWQHHMVSAMQAEPGVSTGWPQLLSALADCNCCQHWLATVAVSTGWLHYELLPQASAMSQGLAAIAFSTGSLQKMSALACCNCCQHWLVAPQILPHGSAKCQNKLENQMSSPLVS